MRVLLTDRNVSTSLFVFKPTKISFQLSTGTRDETATCNNNKIFLYRQPIDCDGWKMNSK